MREPRGDDTGRHGCLVLSLSIALLVLALLASVFVMRVGGEGTGAEWQAWDTRDATIGHLRVGGRKWLIRDEDGDGRVDCFFPTGLARYYVRGFAATDADYRCAGEPMSDALRRLLGELQTQKGRLGARSTSTVDDDGDGTVDRLVSSHNPDNTVWPAPEGSPDLAIPEGDGGRAMLGFWLELERDIRSAVAASGS